VKTKIKLALAALAALAVVPLVGVLTAQTAAPTGSECHCACCQRMNEGGPETARLHHPPPPPPPPVIAVLDANRDGTIDADEIANAATTLLQLDENRDGQLTREELRPPRPFPGGPPPPDFGPRDEFPPENP
jgi:hypothetical protein